MDNEQPVKFINTPLPDIIELKDIKQSYGEKPPIIKGFNLLIEDKPNQGQFVVILGASGCGKCVAEGTWVVTSTGLRRVEDLFDGTEDGLVKDNSGLKLFVGNKFEKISHRYYGGVKPTIIVTTENGDLLEGTKEHPVLVQRSGENTQKHEEWIRMNELKPGDFLIKEGCQVDFEVQTHKICTPRAVPKSFFSRRNKILRYHNIGLNQHEISKLTGQSPMNINRIVRGLYKDKFLTFKTPQFMSGDLAYWLGLVAGDGCITSQFSFTSADKELIEYFSEYVKDYFGVETSIFEKKGTKALDMKPYSSEFIVPWMHKVFGGTQNADTKDVPLIVRKAAFQHQLLFLVGLFDTDGSADLKNKRAEISLNSKLLIDFVCAMLSTMGIGYTRSFRGKSHRVSLRQSQNLHSLFLMERKQLPENPSKPPLKRTYHKIKKIEYGENKVFDLTNPKSHSFVASSFVVHNSSILRYIAGISKPTEGKVLIYGKERTPRDRVGMVFQQYSSFPWMSVLDNVALGLEYQGVSRRERRERAMEIIVKVGLQGQEDKYAQYPTLSGGQLQRVAIARSLLYESKILLMDEPFGALDIETRLQMQDLLAKIWVEIHPTIVFVTHDIPEAVYLGDDIYIMGRNPANIKKMFTSPLPLARNKSMKREMSFINKVNEIEDYMMSVGAAPKGLA